MLVVLATRSSTVVINNTNRTLLVLFRIAGAFCLGNLNGTGKFPTYQVFDKRIVAIIPKQL